MHQLISFFLNKPRLNYVLLLFLFIIGIYSYTVIPKELFPDVETDTVTVTGAYAGASADTLDKMAVTEIEDAVSNISDIEEVRSYISANQFTVILELTDNADKQRVLNDVKDAIELILPDLPSDMDEPSVVIAKRKIPLIQVTISSDTHTTGELIEVAKEIKTEMSKIEHLTDIAIYGEGDPELDIKVDTAKLRAYDVDADSFFAALQKLSYIFPIGKIEQYGSHRFLSTYNGKKEPAELMDTVIKVGTQKIRLGDVATVTKKYSDSATLGSFNGLTSMNINISKAETGNAIELSRIVKAKLAEMEAAYPGIKLQTFSDTSVYIRNRLNTVTSNILFGLILVTLSMYILINKRIAFIVAMGIPVSFIVGIVFFHQVGYSINMISLLGALIAIGVIVDDAIIVAENIQRHIEEGWSPKEAALTGAKEVAMPVLAASLTTVFAFLPMLILSGNMGAFIKMIPVAIGVLILASLIESFIFLPLHAQHLLSPKDKELNWDRVNHLFKTVLRYLIHYRKTSVTLFLIIVPILIVIGFATSRFQFFPQFDGTQLYVSGKLDVNMKVEETFEVAKAIEKRILEHKDELYIESISSVAGFRMDATNQGENAPYFMYMFIDLKKSKEDNVVEKYITPYLSFDYDGEDRVREEKSFAIAEKLRKILDGVDKEFAFQEFEVRGQRAGVVKTDIELQFISPDDGKLLATLEKVKTRLGAIDGVYNIVDDAKEGIAEIKMRVNPYGEDLGIDETTIATQLSQYYLENEKAKSFDEGGIVEIVVSDLNKDHLDRLEAFQLHVPGSLQKVALHDVAEFIEIRNFEKIKKIDGSKRKTVYANVHPETVTATDVMEEIRPFLDEVTEDPQISLALGGEAEQTAQMKVEMGMAALIAMFLMFMTLLIMFDSFKYTVMILSVIPLSLLGMLMGHFIMGMNLTMPSIIGALGLAGVVINDGIIMLDFIRRTTDSAALLDRASLRLRPIVLTSITTLIGLSTLIFFPSGQAKILQPLAVSLGFGLFWGTILNLLYLPTLYAVVNKIKEKN